MGVGEKVLFAQDCKHDQKDKKWRALIRQQTSQEILVDASVKALTGNSSSLAVAVSPVALHLLQVGQRNNEQNQLMPSYGHECHRVARMTIARKNPWGWARPVLTLV
jgi:hypothetical protein